MIVFMSCQVGHKTIFMSCQVGHMTVFTSCQVGHKTPNSCFQFNFSLGDVGCTTSRMYVKMKNEQDFTFHFMNLFCSGQGG